MKKFLSLFVILAVFFVQVAGAQSAFYASSPDGNTLKITYEANGRIDYKFSELKALNPRDFASIAGDFVLYGGATPEQFEKLMKDYVLAKVPDKNEEKTTKLLKEVQGYLLDHSKGVEEYERYAQGLFDWAKKYKLTTTKNVDDMRLSYSITREEVAALLKRSIDNSIFVAPTQSVPSVSFKDAHKIAPEFRDNISYLQKYGIFKGDANGNFRPKSNISVQEVIILVMRLHTGQKHLSDKKYMQMFTELTGWWYEAPREDAWRSIVFEIFKNMHEVK